MKNNSLEVLCEEEICPEQLEAAFARLEFGLRGQTERDDGALHGRVDDLIPSMTRPPDS